MSSEYVVTIGQRRFQVKVISSHLVQVDGQRCEVDLVRLAENHYSLRLDNSVFDVVSDPLPEEINNGFASPRVRVLINTREYIATVDDRRSLLLKSLGREEANKSGSVVVMSPMPGMVVKVEVREGEEVSEGQGLIVLEAMKMENELKAPVRGRVSSVHVQRGTSVEKGEKLVTIESL